MRDTKLVKAIKRLLLAGGQCEACAFELHVGTNSETVSKRAKKASSAWKKAVKLLLKEVQ